MYRIEAERAIEAPIDQVWAAVTDVAAWPSWDPHEEDAKLDGPFTVGTRGWSKPHGGPATWWTITEVDPKRRWGSTCPLPGGALTGLTTFEPIEGGAIRCRKQVEVTGVLTPLFRLWFGPRMRADMRRSIAALETRARALAAANR